MATELGERIGNRIREKRLELRLNQRQLADRMPDAVTNQHISNWERGVNQPSQRYLERLAEALEVDQSYFVAAELTHPDRDHAPNLMSVLGSDDGVALLERVGQLETKLDRLIELTEKLVSGERQANLSVLKVPHHGSKRPLRLLHLSDIHVAGAPVDDLFAYIDSEAQLTPSFVAELFTEAAAAATSGDLVEAASVEPSESA